MDSIVRKNSKKQSASRIVTYVTLVYILLLIVFGIFGDRGILKNYRLYKQNALIEKNIGDLEEENKNLRMEIDNLMGNPRYIEKVARDELNMGTDDEITFIFEE